MAFIDFARFLVTVFFGLFYRVYIIGVENVPAAGAAVLCSNHLGQMDMFFIGYKIKRKIRWMAKQELFKNPILGSVLRMLGAFAVKRGTADIGSVRTALKLIDEGHIIGIYPEATRMRGKTRNESKVKPGAAMIAANTGVPIIPVAVEGRYKLFSKVKVVFGKPFYLDTVKDIKYSNKEFTEMSKNIMDKVYALLEEA